MSLTNMGASNSEETHRERAGQVVECWQSAGTTLELEGTVRTLGCGESLGGCVPGSDSAQFICSEPSLGPLEGWTHESIQTYSLSRERRQEMGNVEM